jgi:hypothetical protein
MKTLSPHYCVETRALSIHVHVKKRDGEDPRDMAADDMEGAQEWTAPFLMLKSVVKESPLYEGPTISQLEM